MTARFLPLGVRLMDWQSSGTSLVLGYPDPADYLSDKIFAGALVGPVANRIAGAGFELDGQTYTLAQNEAPHHLHGGPTGLHDQIWTVTASGSDHATFSCHVPDGTGGYPGNVAYTVRIRLTPSALIYDMRGDPDRPTPINVTQHAHYTLGETGQDLNLSVQADRYTDVTAAMIPTGRIAPVAGDLDLRAGRRVADLMPQGLDVNYCLDPGHTGPVARLSTTSGRHLDVETDAPGLQVYTGHKLKSPFQPCAGICLEPQGWPDAVHHPAFPSIIATPDRPFRRSLRLTLTEPAG